MDRDGFRGFSEHAPVWWMIGEWLLSMAEGWIPEKSDVVCFDKRWVKISSSG